MAKRRTSRDNVSRDQWAAQIAALDATPSAPPARREPVTAGRIVQAALGLVEAEGYDALTMRRVAAVLQVSVGALYAHVRDKAQLDDLMIGELCSRITLPAPDPAQWSAQVADVCRQMRDLYLRYPGIARAALEGTPQSLDALRIYEGLFAILLTAGAAPQRAAWAIDGAFQYVGAYSLVWLRRMPQEAAGGPIVESTEVIERFMMLPADRFPNTVAHAREATSGEGHDRFDFMLGQLFHGLTPRMEGHHEH